MSAVLSPADRSLAAGFAGAVTMDADPATKPHTFTTYVYHYQYGSDERYARFVYVDSPNMEDQPGYVLVGKYDFTLDLPADFDPKARRLELLEAQKKREMADLERRISELRASYRPLGSEPAGEPL